MLGWIAAVRGSRKQSCEERALAERNREGESVERHAVAADPGSGSIPPRPSQAEKRQDRRKDRRTSR